MKNKTVRFMLFVIVMTVYSLAQAQAQKSVLSFSAQQVVGNDNPYKATPIDAANLYYSGTLPEGNTQMQISPSQEKPFATVSQKLLVKKTDQIILMLDKHTGAFGVWNNGRVVSPGSSEAETARKKFFLSLVPCRVDFGNNGGYAYGVPFDGTSWGSTLDSVYHEVLGERDCLCSQIGGKTFPVYLADCLNPLPSNLIFSLENEKMQAMKNGDPKDPYVTQESPEVREIKLSPELQKTADVAAAKGGTLNFFIMSGGQGGSVTNSGNSGQQAAAPTAPSKGKTLTDYQFGQRNTLDVENNDSFSEDESDNSDPEPRRGNRRGNSHRNNYRDDYRDDYYDRAELMEQRRQTRIMRWNAAGVWLGPILGGLAHAGAEYALSHIGNSNSNSGNSESSGSGNDAEGITSNNSSSGFGIDSYGVE